MSSLKRGRRRLLIIHHADEKRLGFKRHLIHVMIQAWKAAGIEVMEVFGTREAPPADVAFLHIDLSIIPPAYLKFAQRYPIVLNGTVTDIRKSHLSLLRIDPGSDYSGPVIVKSALNCAGDPEMVYFRHRSKLQRLFNRKPPGPSHPIRIESKADYRIYATPMEVPEALWKCPDLVIEKFMPEQHNGLYCLREWYFCGDKSVQWVELSPDPIFTSGQQVHHLDVPIPSELHALRKKLGFDYGKFDFTMVDGKPVIFDFNKTTGVIDPKAPKTLEMVQELAGGIDAYFNWSLLPARDTNEVYFYSELTR